MLIRSLALATVMGILFACSESSPSSDTKLYHEVDPFIGTDWVGNVYPGVSTPHGMIQLSPDNGLPGWDRIAGYFYPDSTISGFSHTHLSGTGAGDMYDISFMPTIEPTLRADAPLGVHALFSHTTERAHAGYYRVMLEPYDIEVELTATDRVGVQAYTFHRASDSAMITLDLTKAMNWDRTTSTTIREVEPNILEGYRHSDGWARNQRVYFHSRLSRTPERIIIDSVPLHNDEGKLIGMGYTARLHYRVAQGERITITTALSGVSIDGARANHQAEANLKTFEDYRYRAEQTWQKSLEHIHIEGADSATRRIFYTALYRSQLCPTLYSDVDGRYLGADRKVHQVSKGQHHYSTFSLWDTYRAAHPLYNIIAPERSRDMVQSLIDFGKQNNGHLPVWNMWASETDMMIGYHSIPVIVEAILKGVYTPENPKVLTHLFRTTAERKGYRGLDEYQHYGYVPSDAHREAVSLTLEYAYDDAAIAAWGRHINDRALTEFYTRRATSYQKVWNSKVRFFAPRTRSGVFVEPFDPFAYTEHFTESNAYHYLMSAQHDPEGLIKLMGGRDNLARRLDELFSAPTPQHIQLPIFSTGMIGQYAHGNEPGHHAVYLYNYARQPWRTAELSSEICRKLYTDRPDGLCGNEDCGQMSAWYIFASMGFYPLDPLSGQYELGAPLFKRTQIRVANGKYCTIEAPELSQTNRYIASVTIDGKPWKHSYITHNQIMRGSHIVLRMTSKRGICWY